MKTFQEQVHFYITYHQNPLTRYMHMAAIPLLYFAVMIFLGFIHIVIPGLLEVNFSGIATLVLLIYFFRLNWRLTLVLVPIFILLLWIAHFFSMHGPTSFGLWSFVISLLLGAILLFAGYWLEHKQPSLSDVPSILFISPMFLVAELFFVAGQMQELKDALYKPKIMPNNPFSFNKIYFFQ